MFIKPKAFENFKCTAGRCTDNCCIGWEIDIDPVTLNKYEAAECDFQSELLSGITESSDGSLCFKLKENGRCAFLDENNLCKIQLNMGEPILCDICREHPRFYNEFGDICEQGFGLCCEEAVKLLFKSDGILPCEISKTFVEGECARSFEEARLVAALNLRATLFDILYDENNDIFTVFKKCLEAAKKAEEDFFEKKLYEECVPTENSILLSIAEDTEPIDEKWLPLISEMRKRESEIAKAEEDVVFVYPERKAEYKKIFSYLLYRHIFPAAFDGEMFARTRFCVDYLRLQMLLDAFTYLKSDTFSGDSTINNTKYLSKQIEYSTENTEILMFS